jgi:hypothetical protein
LLYCEYRFPRPVCTLAQDVGPMVFAIGPFFYRW